MSIVQPTEAARTTARASEATPARESTAAAPTPTHSLRRRLLGFVMTAIVLAAAVQAGSAWRSALRQADEMFDYHLQQMAHALRGGIPLAPPTLDGNSSDEYLIQIWGPDGVQLFRSAPTQLPPRAVLGFSDVDLRGARYRVYSVQTPFQTIQIAQDLDARQARARALALRAMLPMALMAPLLMLAAWWGITRSLAPLSRTRKEVSVRAANDLSPLKDDGLPDEVRPLVDEINALFGRLDKAFLAQKSFVSNAAHELRSPLTALKLQVQALERAPDEATRAVAVGRLHQGIERAIRLMQQLLVLARQEAESPTAEAELPQVALDPLVRQAVADVLPQAQARHIDLGIDLDKDASSASVQQQPADGPLVRGDADALLILLRNLLDNAIKYSPEHGRVDVRTGSTAEGPWLQVDDSGPGISPEDQPRVFDRFFRSANAGATGSGLGLAITRAIADRHSARLTLGTSGLGGLSVRAQFPSSQS